MKSNNENDNFKKIFKKIEKNKRILDVGCGFGKNLKLLKQMGFENIYGTDIKEETICKVKDNFSVFLPNDLEEYVEYNSIDVIIMSHIVEHFNYKELIYFIENYLKYLTDGGFLYISTPLLTDKFYSDFDHVKPYYPEGFLSIFTKNDEQVQIKSQFSFSLVDLYFRKSAFSLYLYRGKYLNHKNILPIYINLFLKFLYNFTFKLYSRTTGWQGLFKVNKN